MASGQKSYLEAAGAIVVVSGDTKDEFQIFLGLWVGYWGKMVPVRPKLNLLGSAHEWC